MSPSEVQYLAIARQQIYGQTIAKAALSKKTGKKDQQRGHFV